MKIVKARTQRLIREASELAYLLEGELFRDLILESEAVWVVLDDTGTVVGTAGASTHRKNLDLTVCVLHPSTRGLGLQKKLIDLRLRWGRRMGCKTAWTYAYRENHASMISLLKSNFSPYSVDNSDFAYFARYL